MAIPPSGRKSTSFPFSLPQVSISRTTCQKVALLGIAAVGSTVAFSSGKILLTASIVVITAAGVLYLFNRCDEQNPIETKIIKKIQTLWDKLQKRFCDKLEEPVRSNRHGHVPLGRGEWDQFQPPQTGPVRREYPPTYTPAEPHVRVGAGHMRPPAPNVGDDRPYAHAAPHVGVGAGHMRPQAPNVGVPGGYPHAAPHVPVGAGHMRPQAPDFRDDSPHAHAAQHRVAGGRSHPPGHVPVGGGRFPPRPR